MNMFPLNISPISVNSAQDEYTSVVFVLSKKLKIEVIEPNDLNKILTRSLPDAERPDGIRIIIRQIAAGNSLGTVSARGGRAHAGCSGRNVLAFHHSTSASSGREFILARGRCRRPIFTAQILGRPLVDVDERLHRVRGLHFGQIGLLGGLVEVVVCILGFTESILTLLFVADLLDQWLLVQSGHSLG